MTGRLSIICAIVGLLMLLTIAITYLQSDEPLALNGPNERVDRTHFFDSSAGFRAGKQEHLRMVEDFPARLVLNDPADTFPRRGVWISPETISEFPFTELIPSWNIECPPDTGARFHVRVRDARDGKWSPWLHVGFWGRVDSENDKLIQFARGEVQVDTLLLHRPADAYQVRATLQSLDYTTHASPSLRRITVCYSGRVRDSNLRERLDPRPVFNGQWARDLEVPFRPQSDSPKPLWSQICSPTSTSMVMEYCGVSLPTTQNALAIYDPEYGLFGNWNRAVAYAGQLGLDAYLTRFTHWDQVRALIASGQPVIASIRFRKDENIQSFLYKETAGHLLVIRGFTRSGDVIVNDPARREKGSGAIYKADEMHRAWLDKGGVGYIIRAGTSSKPSAPTSQLAGD